MSSGTTVGVAVGCVVLVVAIVGLLSCMYRKGSRQSAKRNLMSTGRSSLGGWDHNDVYAPSRLSMELPRLGASTTTPFEPHMVRRSFREGRNSVAGRESVSKSQQTHRESLSRIPRSPSQRFAL